MTKIVFTNLGWFYIGAGVVWTALVVSGMVFLHLHRRLPFLQIRRLPLVFTAIVNLHIFGTSCCVVYTIGPIVPCDAQFWIMSIYLPFGIALLQAANSQFQHVASQQRRYAQFGSLDDSSIFEKSRLINPALPWWKRSVERIRRKDKVTKILIFIGIGMVIELLLTFVIYFGSEMFHPSYGFFKAKVPGTEQQREVLCFEGWEWWLSIVWQFFWAWIYAPYMLWETRNIHDTHGWRIQTICCCIAGLPASPLWLAGLYVPQMAPVNAAFIPPQWFALSIFFIEVFTIGFPCWQVIKTHNLKQETLDAIATWERRNHSITNGPEAILAKSAAEFTGSTLAASVGGKSVKTGRSRASASSRDSTLTMAALENVLRNNPRPLLEFASLKDFSGENVSFLCHITDWKNAYALCKEDPSRRHDLFIGAVRIHSHFVSLEYSEFPVNISSRTAKTLHQMFDEAADLLNRRRSTHSDSATPFDDVSTNEPTTIPKTGLGLEGTLGQANLQSVTQMAELNCDGQDDIPIPETFNAAVFDDAENEIKYLVLTNTWPKFVNAGFERASQAEKRGEPHILDPLRKYLCGMERIV